MNSVPLKPAISSQSRALGWILARVLLFGIGGVGSGWLSWRLLILGDLQNRTWIWLAGPGVTYGVFWLVAAWVPGTLSVRPHTRRSLGWTAAFLTGSALSYMGAYYTAYYTAQYLNQHIEWSIGLTIAGFLGGIPGGLGLVCTWSLLYRSIDSWLSKSLLTAVGAMLGATLVLWDINGDNFRSLLPFFAIWQGGMAAAFAAIDGAWRMGGRGDP